MPAKRPKHPRSPASPPCLAHEIESAPPAPPAGRGFVLKRAYDPAGPADGYRVLVDRLWPRGLSKARARVDAWARELTPSDALRRAFHADRSRWSEFERRYRGELGAQREALEALRRRARRQRVTLVYAAREATLNHAMILLDVLTHGPGRPRPRAVPDDPLA